MYAYADGDADADAYAYAYTYTYTCKYTYTYTYTYLINRLSQTTVKSCSSGSRHGYFRNMQINLS